MREIYTYANPLLMNKDGLIWKMVNQYPQFCASDTLSQGMIQFYGRKEFGIIQTINNLQKALVGAVTDNTQFDMQLFLDVSHELRSTVCSQEVKDSFRNDLSEIVQAIRYLLFLDADPDKLLVIDNITAEQKELFNIYKEIYPKYKSEIENLMNRDREEIEDAIRGTVINEAEYVLGDLAFSNEDEDYHCKDLAQALDKLSVLQKKIILKREGCIEVGHENPSKEKWILERVEYAIDLISRLDSVDVNTIIVHGVHRFTPEILMVLRLLEKQGFNVIFLIHYVDKLPQIYGTWKEVYSWTKEDFKNVHFFDITAGSAVGKELAKVYSGVLSSEKLSAYKSSYENLSEFAVGEVRKTFSLADKVLSKMKIQYYAVDNTDANEILKNYFPEQFKKKPFLSYPIGQFILGLYNMWDFENSYMRYVPESLRECVASGIFEKDGLDNVAAIYDDLSLYIGNLDNLSDVQKRLKHLKDEENFIERNGKLLGGLKAIGYFSRDNKDIDKLIIYLQLLNELSISIFVQENDQISFNTHFKHLMEVLAGTVNDSALVHKSEIQLVQELLAALRTPDRKDVVGDFSDVRDALTFFLHQSKGDESSNWIVRNFEQLDGAVLLADFSKAREYHFALLSMKNMTRNAKDELPWPLTEELFYGYDCQLESSIQACALSNKERANFLKYSLFYAAFFFRKRVTFSYIVNQNDEKQRAYYLFDLLKLKDRKQAENADVNFSDTAKKSVDRSFDFNSLTIDQKEMFAICRYKFFLNRVLNEEIIYRSDFQIKYFLQNYIIQVVMEDKRLTMHNHAALVKRYIARFRQMLPNYDNIYFADLERKVLKEVYNSLEFSINNHRNTHKQPDWYKRRKKNFLLAQWVDNGSNEMDFNNISQSVVVDYMLNNDILLSADHRPHMKVCENCNYSSDCLMNYFEGLRGKGIEV